MASDRLLMMIRTTDPTPGPMRVVCTANAATYRENPALWGNKNPFTLPPSCPERIFLHLQRYSEFFATDDTYTNWSIAPWNLHLAGCEFHPGMTWAGFPTEDARIFSHFFFLWCYPSRRRYLSAVLEIFFVLGGQRGRECCFKIYRCHPDRAGIPETYNSSDALLVWDVCKSCVFSVRIWVARGFSASAKDADMFVLLWTRRGYLCCGGVAAQPPLIFSPDGISFCLKALFDLFFTLLFLPCSWERDEINKPINGYLSKRDWWHLEFGVVSEESSGISYIYIERLNEIPPNLTARSRGTRYIQKE